MEQAHAVFDTVALKYENLFISPQNIVLNVTVDDLPNEVLRQIFALLADTPGARSALGRVCYRWHQIVKLTHEFWSIIHLQQLTKLVKQDPELWARQAGYGPHPLTVIWEVSWHVLAASSHRAYTTAFQKFIEAAPYWRWRELKMNRAGRYGVDRAETKDIPIDFSAATFDNLETFELNSFSGGGDELDKLVEAVAKTGKELKTFKHKGLLLHYNNAMDTHLKAILSRVSTLHCEQLPPQHLYPDGLPKSITRLHLTSSSMNNWNFRSVTNLEIERFYIRSGMDFQFPNVTILDISSLSVAFGTGDPPIVFPRLRLFKVGISHLDAIKYLSAPKLESINITLPITTPLPPDSSNADNNPGLPCPSVDFSAGIHAADLPAALSWFPNVEALTVSLSLNANDPNMSLLCLSSDLSRHQRSSGSVDSAVGYSKHTKIFDYGPKLGSLCLRLPTFKEDYNIGLEWSISLLTARRKSPLKPVEVIWDDGREIFMTPDDL